MAVGVLTVAGAFVLRERDLIFVGVLALVLPALAWAATGLRRVSLAVEHRVVPQRLQAGEGGVVRVRLRNTYDRTTRPLDVLQPGVRLLMPGARRTVPPIAPGEWGELRIPIEARRRGSYTIGSPLLRQTDPLGLSQVRRRLPARTEVLVLPTVVPLVGLPRGLNGRGSATGTSSATAAGGDPDAGVRAYRMGDDIRSVHWRASARLEEDLVVRVAAATTLGTALLVLDHRTSAYRLGPPEDRDDGEDGLEVAVTLGASIGHHLLEQDVDLTVVDHTGHVLVQGHDVADELLGVLAAAGTRRGELHPTAPAGTDAVVAVVGPLSGAEARTLAGLRRGAAIAFVLDDAAGVRDGSECAAVLRAAGWRVVPVDVGDAATPDGGAHLAHAWRGACTLTSVAARGPAHEEGVR
ncbi:hypothetical protein C8046_10620 [Serinibacter arcticus]|uniref:DUF58 domain-containing protein n=1 Tax=Serinibacter arcticus TaxID=1655435 RepID=A0A2U1ZVS9_9MICO|nr:hypothetical protein C8046_10620 [Serinibacter arcticus]